MISRIRRIKCDEQRPNCLKCSTTGRICDGYEVPASVATARRPLAPQSQGFLVQAHRVNSSIGLDSYESQLFDFFRRKTVNEITGCFSSKLFEQFLLQASHSQPIIIHAAAAVGAMHLNQKSRRVSTSLVPPNEPHQSLALKQYVKSMGYLRTLLNQSPDQLSSQVVLMACFLFVCMEMLQGNRIEALVHMRTGLKVLRGHFSSPHTAARIVINGEPTSLVDTLTEIYVRLDYDASIYGGGRPRLTLNHHIGDKSATFSSIAEARQILDVLANSYHAFHEDLKYEASNYISNTIPEDKEQLIPRDDRGWGIKRIQEVCLSRQLAQSWNFQTASRWNEIKNGIAHWTSAFTSFVKTQAQNLSTENLQALSLLEMQHFFINFQIATCQETRSMPADRFNPLFERVIDLATRYISYLKSKGTDSYSTTTFTLESGAIPAIFLAGMKCRDSVIRRRAVDLLKTTPCQEGMSEGSLIGRWLEEFVRFEESGIALEGTVLLPEQIPEAARWLDVVFTFDDSPGAGKLVCGRYLHDSTGELVIVEKVFVFRSLRLSFLRRGEL